MPANPPQTVRLNAEAGFRLPKLDGSELPERYASATYLDTPDHRLASLGITLSYRAQDGHGAWHLRLPRDGGDVALQDASSPVAVPPRFLDLVYGATSGVPVAAIATLDTVQRGVRVTGDGREVADVAVGEVVMHAGGSTVRCFDEIEVAALEGRPDQLRKLKRRLLQAGARNGAQRPLLLRALGLELTGAPRPRKNDPPRRQLACMLLANLREIHLHDAGTRMGDDPEELHRHRVAVRRLRALLRAARPMLDPAWADGLREELGWLGGVLGEVRDLDVLLERLEAESAELPANDARSFAPILRLVANRREAARTLMLAELRSPRYALLLDRLDRELADPAPGGKEVSPKKIARAEFKRARKAHRKLRPDCSDHELHELRKKVKKTRYAAELAAPSRGRKATRFVRAAKVVQDVLGEHQDAVVAEQHLRELATVAGDAPAAVAAGMLIERERARRDAARAAFPEAWAKLERRGRKAWR